MSTTGEGSKNCGSASQWNGRQLLVRSYAKTPKAKGLLGGALVFPTFQHPPFFDTDK